MTGKIRTVVIDDHPLFRDGVVVSLTRDRSIEVVGHGGTAEDAIRSVEKTMPDVVLLDINMPGGGIECGFR